MKLKTIKGEFEPHYMNNSKSILDYFDHVQTIVNQMQVTLGTLELSISITLYRIDACKLP